MSVSPVFFFLLLLFLLYPHSPITHRNMLSNISNELLNLDPYALDEWLETDLRESGLLASNEEHASTGVSTECTPLLSQLEVSPTLKYEPISPVTKAGSPDIPSTGDYLQPFIKALTLLGSIQYNQSTGQKRKRSAMNSDDVANRLHEETEDLVALKRQRNTDAARRSRQRKVMKMESLEKRVQQLESENELLKLRAAVNESERMNLETKEKRYRVRILDLEQRLIDAHKALLNFGHQEVISH
ncbi:hypothetical protein BDB01DRAFT_834795 [Pilobolus umbonatus]|nr:hypothetical protein BDB01DRAFT_834795 [Pilobolus umbonatus]